MTTKTTKKGAIAAPRKIAIPDDEVANAVIESLGAGVRELQRLELELQEHVAGLKASFEEEAAPIKTAIEEHALALQAYCTAHRERLVAPGTKTATMPSGRLQWRDLPRSVSLRKVDDVIARCKQLKLTQFIRTKEEVDKEAMLRDAKLAETIAGVTIRSPGEQFYIKPAALDVELDARGQVAA
jgi:phage host-nuclease inhibitor protein Gam